MCRQRLLTFAKSDFWEAPPFPSVVAVDQKLMGEIMEAAKILQKPDGWHDNRRTGLGGSDANIIMSGDPQAVLALWEEKTGRREPEDLSRVLPVQMGSWTEPLNRHWYEMITGREVVTPGIEFRHPQFDFMRCEVDGVTSTEADETAVFEAKHINAFGKIEDAVVRYMPQLHHNMACGQFSWVVLSVFQGTQKYEYFEIERDDLYMVSLLDAEGSFWRAVQNDTPPIGIAHVEPPRPEQMREADMTGNNEWASNADDWLGNKNAAKVFEKAGKALKGLMEPDMSRAFGHGVEIARAKNGSLRIKETKEC